MAVYKITAIGLELPHGKRLKTNNSTVVPGDLCLCEIGKYRIVGRWIPGWIIQPRRWVRITGEVVIKGLGLILLVTT